MKKILSLLLCASLPFSYSLMQAQSMQPKWQPDLKSNVSWQRLTPLGNLIVASAKGLKAIDTETGTELWNIPGLANASEASYRDIEGTPFFSVTPTSNPNDIYIIEPFNGSVLFSSIESGLEKVTNEYFLYRNNKIMIIGYETGSKSPSMIMVDMSTGKKLWAQGNEFGMASGVKDLGNDEFLVTSAFFAFRIKASTGEVIWKQPLDQRMKALGGFADLLDKGTGNVFDKNDLRADLLVPVSHPELFIVAAQTKVTKERTDSKGQKTKEVSYESKLLCMDMKTGEAKWNAPLQFPYTLGVLYPHPDGIIYCAGNGGFINMFDYSTSAGLLGKKGKGLSVNGSVTEIAEIANEKIFIISKSGSKSSLYFLNPETKMYYFEKPVKLEGQVNYTQVLSKGILVGSDKEVNLLNINTGEFYFEKPIEGGSHLVASDDKFIYCWNTKDNALMKMPVDGSSMQRMTTGEIKIQENEDPVAIEITANGIFVRSEQTVMLVGTDGKVIFQSYFPSPQVRGLNKALLIASAVRAAYYTASYGMTSAAFAGASQSIQVKDANSKMAKDITGGIATMYGDASKMGMSYTKKFTEMATQRFKATSQTQNYVFILTEPEKKQIRLVQVSKATGKKMTEIDLGKDKEPFYNVDELSGKIYYRRNPTTIACYQF